MNTSTTETASPKPPAKIIGVGQAGEISTASSIAPIRDFREPFEVDFADHVSALASRDDFIHHKSKVIWSFLDDITAGRIALSGTLMATGEPKAIDPVFAPRIAKQLLRSLGYAIVAKGELAYSDVVLHLRPRPADTSATARFVQEVGRAVTGSNPAKPNREKDKNIQRRGALAWLKTQIRDGGKIDGELKPKETTNEKLFAEMKERFGLGEIASKQVLRDAKEELCAPDWGRAAGLFSSLM